MHTSSLQALQESANYGISAPTQRSPPAHAVQRQCLTCVCDFASGMTRDQLVAVSQHMSGIFYQHRQCLSALDAQQPDLARSIALAALELSDDMPVPVQALGKSHIWRMRLHEGLMRSYVSLGNEWPAALTVAKKLVPVYEMVYPQV